MPSTLTLCKSLLCYLINLKFIEFHVIEEISNLRKQLQSIEQRPHHACEI